MTETKCDKCGKPVYSEEKVYVCASCSAKLMRAANDKEIDAKRKQR